MAKSMARSMVSWAEKDQELFAGREGRISILRTVKTRQEKAEMDGKRPVHRKASPWHPFWELTTFLLTSKESSVLEMKIHPLVR